MFGQTIKIVRLLGLAAAAILGQSCVASGERSAREKPPLLVVASAESRIGGEALFEGELGVRNGCLIAFSAGGVVLPIFDHSVLLDESGRTIIDRGSGKRVEIGGRLRASAAYLREHGRGWPIAQVEKLAGAELPEGCGESIVRLNNIEPTLGQG